MTENHSSEPAAPTLTEAADRFIRRMLRFGGKGPNAGFRLEVRPGGCSGMAADFSIEAAPKAEDHELLVGGLRFFLPTTSRLLLDGVIIDFVETTTEAKLAFIDPNAAGCGCSASDAKRAPSASSARA